MTSKKKKIEITQDDPLSIPAIPAEGQLAIDVCCTFDLERCLTIDKAGNKGECGFYSGCFRDFHVKRSGIELLPNQDIIRPIGNEPALLVTYGCLARKKKKSSCPELPDRVICFACKSWFPTESKDLAPIGSGDDKSTGQLVPDSVFMSDNWQPAMSMEGVLDSMGSGVAWTPAPEAVPLPISKDSILTDDDKEAIANGSAVHVDLEAPIGTAPGGPSPRLEGFCETCFHHAKRDSEGPCCLVDDKVKDLLPNISGQIFGTAVVCPMWHDSSLMEQAHMEQVQKELDDLGDKLEDLQQEAAAALAEAEGPVMVQDTPDNAGQQEGPPEDPDDYIPNYYTAEEAKAFPPDCRAGATAQEAQPELKTLCQWEPGSELSKLTFNSNVCEGCPKYQECESLANKLQPVQDEASPGAHDYNAGGHQEPPLGYMIVDIKLISPNPNNPRTEYDEEALKSLAESIRQHGILLPLVCVPEDDPYLVPFGLRIVVGERRYRAAQMIGLQELPVIVRDINQEEEMSLMMTENMQRRDLTPIEEAKAFVMMAEQGWTQGGIASILGLQQPFVANRIRLLKLPAAVQEHIMKGSISAYHGLELIRVAGLPDICEDVVKNIMDHGVTVAGTEDAINRIIAQKGRHLSSANCYSESQKPIFDADFEGCDKCSSRVLAKDPNGSGSKRHPYCMDNKCWQEKRDRALELEAKKRIEALPKKKDGEEKAVNMSTLDSRSYERFKPGWSTAYHAGEKRLDVQPCIDESCEFLKVGQGATGYICLKPSCFKDRLKKAESAARKELTKKTKSFEDVKDTLISQGLFDEAGQVRHDMLASMAAAAIYDGPSSPGWSDARKQEELYKMMGWPSASDKGWTERTEDLVKRVAGLDERSLWQVLVFSLTRFLTEDHIIYKEIFTSDQEGVMEGAVSQ